MKSAYLDTSAFLAVVLHETNAPALRRILAKFDRLFSSNLLEAEARAATAHEGADRAALDRELKWVHWILPARPLSTEFETVLRHGRLRGADLWHVATAIYFSERPDRLAFITCDEAQAGTARGVGFSVHGVSLRGARES